MTQSLLGPLLLAAADGPTGRTFWMPPQASTIAAEVDWLYYFIYWLCLAFFVAIIALKVLFAVRYARRTPGQQAEPDAPTHNTPIEVTWSVIPLILVIVIFYVGFEGYMKLSVAPQNAYTIDVTGKKWSWSFAYPNGVTDGGEIHVPAGEPVKLVMTSQDVLHSFFVPDFRVKQDVLPGRYTTLWFEALRPPEGQDTAEHFVFCTEYCGTSHSDMRATLVVHKDRAHFDAWLEKKGTPEITVDAGRELYEKNCKVCHLTDKPYTGPSFGDLAKWLKDGAERPLAAGGAVKVDEEYLRESIWEPNAKLAQGFSPAMPTFKGQLKDPHIRALILYIRSLAQ